MSQTGTPTRPPFGTEIGPVVPRWLSETIQGAVPTLGSRVLGTVLIIAATVLLVQALRRAGPWIKSRGLGDIVVETAQSGAVLLVTLLATVLLVVAWDAGDEVLVVWQALNITRTEVVRSVFSLALLLGAYALTRATKRTVHRVTDIRGAVSQHQREIAHHFVQVTVYTVAILTVLSVWRIDIGNLLLGAGFLGIVLGLAARQTLGAVLAGFVVLFSRPFSLGDWVVIGDNEGIVQDITIVNTRVKTFDDEIVMIPNDVVTSTEVINRSKTGRYRVTVKVGVDYETDVERAAAVAEEAMSGTETVLQQPEPHVVLSEFGESAVSLQLRFWIDNPTARRKWRAQTEVIEAVHEAFDAEGIKIPFPQRELMARQETDGFRISPTRELDTPQSSPTTDGGDLSWDPDDVDAKSTGDSETE